MICFLFKACPYAGASGRAIRYKSSFATLIAGFSLLSLTQVRAYIYVVRIKEVFFTSFELGGGWVGKPDTPTKNTSFALGMRRVAKQVRQHRSDSAARSTPTA